MKVAICDDELAISYQIEEVLRTYHSSLFEIDIFQNPNYLLESCRETSYDFFILDIEMPEMTGIELAEKIRTLNRYNPIIFLTNYKQYMEKVFQVQTFDYLLKPIEQAQMNKVLDRLMNYLQVSDQRFVFNFNKRTYSLLFSDIIYFEKEKRSVKIYTKNEQFQTLMTTAELVTKLSDDFIQIHYSFIINSHYFKSLTADTVSLTDDTQLPLSRKFSKQAKEQILDKLRSMI